MKNAILASLLLLSGIAQAAQTTKLECGFTEPFFNLDIDLVKKEITKTSPNWEQGGEGTVSEIIATNIRLQSDLRDPLAPKYQIVGSNGAIIAHLQLDMAGSDGMSDIVYPFNIQFDGMHGGCSSNLIKTVNPNH